MPDKIKIDYESPYIEPLTPVQRMIRVLGNRYSYDDKHGHMLDNHPTTIQKLFELAGIGYLSKD